MLWCAAAAVVHDRTLAHDIVQQAAIVGLENLNDFSPGTSFVSWMVRIVRNIALNEFRRTRRRATAPADPAIMDVANTAPAALDGIDASTSSVTSRGAIREDQPEFDDAMMHALGTLDDTARSCLLLRVVLDLPYRQIALALDIPEGTAASHVHRARAVMRKSLTSRVAGGHA